MKKLLMTTGAALAVAAATSANAATFGAKPLDCKGNTGCFLLTIEGDLKLGDDEEFKKLIAKNNVKLAVVGLHSNGGNVLAAYGIGNFIRDSGYTTFVPSWGYCVSACGMIWMAGATRQAEENAHIGFHGAYLADNKGRVIGGASAGNALMGSFYARLGLNDMAVVYLTSAGPKDMRLLRSYWGQGGCPNFRTVSSGQSLEATSDRRLSGKRSLGLAS
jgi:hypothetical protein